MIHYKLIEMYIDLQVKMMLDMWFLKAYLMEPKKPIPDE